MEDFRETTNLRDFFSLKRKPVVISNSRKMTDVNDHTTTLIQYFEKCNFSVLRSSLILNFISLQIIDWNL